VLFTVLALAPAIPSRSLRQSHVPAEVRTALRSSSRLDDPVPVRTCAGWRRWRRAIGGFSFVSRRRFDKSDPAAAADDPVRDRDNTQIPADPDRYSVGVFAATRPIRSSIRSPTHCVHRLLAADVFHGPPVHLVFSIYLDWLPFVTAPTSRAAGDGMGALSQALMPIAVLGLFQAASLTRYVRSAVLDVVRLDLRHEARAKVE